MKTMYYGIVESKRMIQLLKHRRLMPFEISWLASRF